MKVFNFSHSLAPAAVEQLNDRFGTAVEVIQIPVNLDMGAELLPQINELMKPHSRVMNGTEAFCIVLPGMSIAAVAIAAAVSGFSGSLPLVVELRMDANRTFVVNDVIDFQAFRSFMRQLR